VDNRFQVLASSRTSVHRGEAAPGMHAAEATIGDRRGNEFAASKPTTL
jgi:hypothetical protein